MSIWAICNQKGGVGKTTTSLCVARLLAADGARVILMDLDPHASLTRVFGVPANPPPRGSHDLFGTEPPPLASLLLPTALPGLSLVPGQPALATLERASANRPGLGRALIQALAGSEALAEHVVLDCPPVLGVLMVNALAVADRLVIPTQTDPLALHGLAEMVRTADMVERSRGRPLPRHILPTLYDRRTRAGNDSLAQLHSRGAQVWNQAIPMDTRLRDATALTHPSDPACRGFDAYREAVAWLLAQDSARLEAA